MLKLNQLYFVIRNVRSGKTLKMSDFGTFETAQWWNEFVHKAFSKRVFFMVLNDLFGILVAIFVGIILFQVMRMAGKGLDFHGLMMWIIRKLSKDKR